MYKFQDIITQIKIKLIPIRKQLLYPYGNNIFLAVYNIGTQYRVWKFRKKNRIKVLFVISQLGSWKTEPLYISMETHPKFVPIVGITDNPYKKGCKDTLEKYLRGKEINYVDLDRDDVSIKAIAPDILFYYMPYKEYFTDKNNWDKHKSYVHCFINYFMSTSANREDIDRDLAVMSWKVFVENEGVMKARRELMRNKGSNCILTGTPIQDFLLSNKSNFKDPWKVVDKNERKRIIYAPHHSFKGTNGTNGEHATFLEYGEYILSLAIKYKDVAQFAFKPHPNLYVKLLDIWGKKKTDAYYNQWAELNNCQYENGEYMGLFKYSDAMIHDCASFMVEYMYTQNPVLYLDSDTCNDKPRTKVADIAFKAHYHSNSRADIEKFILNVISGKDSMKATREEFYKNYLLPPHNKTACDNIIEAILGEGYYKNLK